MSDLVKWVETEKQIDDLLIEEESIIKTVGIQAIHLVGEQFKLAKEKVKKLTQNKKAPGFYNWAFEIFGLKKRTVCKYIRAFETNETDIKKIWGNNRAFKGTIDVDNLLITDPRLINDDFNNYELDNKVDCIITDPPYGIAYEKEWVKLNGWANRNLKQYGFLISYFGQINIPAFLESIKLNYYWTFSLIHTGNKQLINPRNIFCGWKPIFVFQNGFKRIDKPVDDIIMGTGREKTDHQWQQAEEEIAIMINAFTDPGDLICDPFMGSGTILKKAQAMNRNILGYETDEQSYKIAVKKIMES